MIMGIGLKRYIGGMYDETLAARTYDRYALHMQGPKVSEIFNFQAKTNFSYTAAQLTQLLKDGVDLSSAINS